MNQEGHSSILKLDVDFLKPQFFKFGPATQYLEISYILFLPIVVLFLYKISPFNNSDGFLDAWIYFSYANNFQDLFDRYSLPYYAVRFGLIFPLSALISIFGPIWGYLVFVYSMAQLSGIPVYLLFRKLYSVSAAVLAFAILISSVWFARTILWTHPDAAAVPYLIAAVALMFLELRYRRMANCVIGALIALAVNSNAFALLIGGLIGVSYLVYFRSSLWTRIRSDILWISGGFFFIFLAGSIGYYICCGRYNYLTPTISMLQWSARGEGIVYQKPVEAMLSENYLYLPLFLTIAMFLIGKWGQAYELRLISALKYYLVAVTLFVVWYEFVYSAAILELFYYFSFFLVPCVFCMALIPVSLARASHSETSLLTFATVSYLSSPLLFVYGMVSPRSIPTWAFVTSLGLVLLLLVGSLYFRSVIPYALIGFVLVSNLFWQASPSAEVGSIYGKMFGSSDTYGLSRYRLGLKFINILPHYQDDRRSIVFGYNESDRLANSLQSTYLWGYSRFPNLPNVKNGAGRLLEGQGENIRFLYKHEKSWLVLFDRDEDNVHKWIEELDRLPARFVVGKKHKICEESICYTLAILDMRSLPSHMKNAWDAGEGQPVNVELDWSHPGEGARIFQSGSKVSILTHPKAWYFGAVASLVFSKRPSSKPGIIRILVSVKEGKAGIGFTGFDHNVFIDRIEVWPDEKPQELFFKFDNLDVLERLVVSSWNEDKSSKVQVLEFSLRDFES